MAHLDCRSRPRKQAEPTVGMEPSVQPADGGTSLDAVSLPGLPV